MVIHEVHNTTNGSDLVASNDKHSERTHLKTEMIVERTQLRDSTLKVTYRDKEGAIHRPQLKYYTNYP